MATFRRRTGKWNVRVKRYNNKTISKTFIQNIILNFCSALIKINTLKILNLKLKF
jgi:hypothetical protein